MKTMSMKLVIMMAVCLHLTACGKSKSDSSVQAAPTVEAPTMPDDVSKAETTDEAGDQVASEDQNKDDQNKKDTDVPTAPGNEIHAKTQSVDEKEKKPVAQKIESSGNVSIDELRKEANKYSGASDDYLRSFLMSKERSLSESQQIKNMKAAQSILSANLKIDRPLVDGNRTIVPGSGDIALSLTTGSSKNKRTVLFGGLMKSDRTSKLRSRDGINAELVCMDAPISGCEVALVSLKLGSGDVKIIFRKTAVQIDDDFGRKQCMTQACEDIYAMFRQSDAAVGIVDVKTIANSKMETVEVINGKSTFRTIIRTRGNTRGGQVEGIMIAGDLLNQDLNPVMNIPAVREFNANDIPDFLGFNIQTNMHRAMSDVRIVGNDGIGSITVNVNMKMLENGSNDSFSMKMTRLGNDIRPSVTTLK